jgi:ADP-ribosylation factor-like protein 4
MEEAKMELMRTAKAPENSRVPILVLANKQDLPGAKDPTEVARILGLSDLNEKHLWHVQSSCSIIGEGLDEGLQILYDMINEKKRLTKLAKKKR